MLHSLAAEVAAEGGPFLVPGGVDRLRTPPPYPAAGLPKRTTPGAPPVKWRTRHLAYEAARPPAVQDAGRHVGQELPSCPQREISVIGYGEVMVRRVEHSL